MFDTISCLYIGVVLVWLIVLYYLHCKVLLYCNCTVGVLLGHSPVTPLTYGDVYYNIVFMYWRCIGWCIIELVLIVKCYCIVLVGVLLGHSGSGDSSDRGRWDSLALPTHLLMDAQHWKQPLLLPFCLLCFGNKYIREQCSRSSADCGLWGFLARYLWKSLRHPNTTTLFHIL